MLKRTENEIRNSLWGMADLVRGSLKPYDRARIVTALWTLKVVIDNHRYFGISDLDDLPNFSFSGGDATKSLRSLVFKVENKIPLLSGVFSVIDWESIDFKGLYRLVQELDQQNFAYESMENPDPMDGTIALVADAWFDQVIRSEGSWGLEVSTPKEVSQLCARLVSAPEVGSVYDGTFGIGTMIIEDVRNAKRNGQKVPEIFAQEKQEQTWAMGKMNLVLHGIREANIALGDTLVEPYWIEKDHNLMQFDSITMQPPFSLKLSDKDKGIFETDLFGRFRYGIPSAAHADMAFVQHAAASLRDRGKVALIVAHGVLFRGGTDETIRKGLLQDDLIEAVVYLPRNLLVGTGIHVAILVLNKKNPHPGQVLFIKADEEFQASRLQNVLRPEDIEKICDTYYNAVENDGYSRLVETQEIAASDWNLNISRYIDTAVVDSKIGEVQVSIRSYIDSGVPKVRLADISEIERGFGSSKDFEGEETDATHRLINLSDVDEDGNIHLHKTTPISGETRKLRIYELSAKNILLSSRGTALKVAVVPDTVQDSKVGFVASANFIVIRLREGFDPYFVKAFLESPVGMKILQSYQRGSAVPVLSHKDVHDILIPNLSPQLQHEIADTSKSANEEYRKALEEAKLQYHAKNHSLYNMMGINMAYNASTPLVE